MMEEKFKGRLDEVLGRLMPLFVATLIANYGQFARIF